MIPGTGTLFNWTLRMDSKSVYPHVIRAAFAFFMLFSISIAFFEAFGTSRTGLRYFESLCYLNVLIITVAGVSYFVTAVTEEKDAGTFALLRLAGMTPLSITLGKSTSRLVTSLMLLIVQLPFTFLAITLGGILWNQIVASYLALAAWMILVANMALLCSVFCATSGRAAGLAASLLVLFFVLPGFLPATAAAIPPGLFPAAVTRAIEAVPDAIAAVSVTRRIDDLLRSSEGVMFFDRQFWLSITIAVVCFVISTLSLDVGTTTTELGGPPGQPRLRRYVAGRSWKQAVVWKEFLFFCGGHVFAATKLLAGMIILALFYYVQHHEHQSNGWLLTGDYAWSAFLTFAGVLTAEVLVYASGCLFSEIRQGTHTVLAVLPCSTSRLLLEKMAGGLVALWPVTVCLVFTAVAGQHGISKYLSDTMVISYLAMLAFSAHVAVLLSLYTRWAALPLTVLISIPAFFCLAAPILGLTSMTMGLASSQNIRSGLFLTSLVNLFWTWLFVLLPLQIFIRDRWITVSQH